MTLSLGLEGLEPIGSGSSGGVSDWLNFNGSFEPECQQDAVHDSLVALINMILEGPNIQHQAAQENASSTAGISLAQPLMFNNTKHARATSSATIRHNQDKETPLAVYIALVIYAETQNSY